MSLFDKYKIETEQDMMAKMEVIDENQANVREHMEQLNELNEKLQIDLEAKTKNFEEMAEKLAVKSNDYSRLSDSFYRLKKEKDENDAVK